MLRLKKEWNKISRFEFWPLELFYAPFFFQWLYYSFRRSTFLYFSNVNSKVPFGGMLGYSKFDMIKDLPKTNVPKTLFFHKNDPVNDAHWNEIKFPCIYKPDQGERGRGVTVISNLEAWKSKKLWGREDFLLQSFCNNTQEFGVLYYKTPKGLSGITSVTKKAFLQITGDGSKTLSQLIIESDRAKPHLSKFEEEFKTNWNQIILKNETIVLEPIGNHCRGTTFIDSNQLISEELIAVFDKITEKMPWFHYGRFDLKAPSEEALLRGEGIEIFELNGVNSEATHIYQPNYRLFSAYKHVSKNLRLVYQISKELDKNGVKVLEKNKDWFAARKARKQLKLIKYE